MRGVPIRSSKSGQKQSLSCKKTVTRRLYELVLVLATATITLLFSLVVNESKLNSSTSVGGIGVVQNERLNTAMLGRTAVTSQFLKNNDVTAALLPKGRIDYSDYTGPSRAFTKFEHAFPCYPGEKKLMLQTPAHEGILFHRPMKTGSTTMTGVLLRLVHNRGQKLGFEKCKHRSIHGSGRSFEFGLRDRSKSFLFSIIREPQARALSQIFHFEVSHMRREPTDSYLRSRLLSNYYHLHYFADLGVRQYTNSSQVEMMKLLAAKKIGYNSSQQLGKAWKSLSPRKQRQHGRILRGFNLFGSDFTPHKVIGDILEDYDLVGIMERMDESLVALQMLLNLTTKEILYTRARSGGSFSNSLPPHPCIYILPIFTSPGMKEFLASDEWKEHIAADVEFLKAAHKSLDRTIKALGREEFNRKLSIFQNALKLAAINCAGRVRTMCTAGGEVVRPVNTTCYVWGEGCDHDCIDELEL
ncbi:sulfotransferase family [Fragilaria crotonensis]|nr:sulfotransferase family [Fragilaria crotonensis]